MRAWIVHLYDEVDDIGEHYIPHRVFMTREAADREIEAWGDHREPGYDGEPWDTHIGGNAFECEVVGWDDGISGIRELACDAIGALEDRAEDDRLPSDVAKDVEFDAMILRRRAIELGVM